VYMWLFLVNMELFKDYRDRLCVNYHKSPSISDSSIIARSKQSFLNFGWPLNRGKDDRETLIGTTKWWRWSLMLMGYLVNRDSI